MWDGGNSNAVRRSYPEHVGRWSTQQLPRSRDPAPRPIICLPVIPSQRTSAPASSGAFFFDFSPCAGGSVVPGLIEAGGGEG
jgi:hypothetical protein